MKAIASRTAGKAFTHRIDIRHHEFVADEPVAHGGEDDGPSPQELLAASLASCTAITIEMYAKRKGWDLGQVEVQCEYMPAERGCPTNFTLVMRLSNGCTDEQVERLRVIAAKCPVHRTLDGEVRFNERIELVTSATDAAPDRPRRRSLGGADRRLAQLSRRR